MNSMTQEERRIYLIKELLKEQPHYKDTPIQKSISEQELLFRTLFNICTVGSVSRQSVSTATYGKYWRS